MLISYGCRGHTEKKETEPIPTQACLVEDELFIKLPRQLKKLISKSAGTNIGILIYMIVDKDTVAMPALQDRIRGRCAIYVYDMVKEIGIGEELGKRERISENFERALIFFEDKNTCIQRRYLRIQLTLDWVEKIENNLFVTITSIYGDTWSWEVIKL
jgi:hypothetical protein